MTRLLAVLAMLALLPGMGAVPALASGDDGDEVEDAAVNHSDGDAGGDSTDGSGGPSESSAPPDDSDPSTATSGHGEDDAADDTEDAAVAGDAAEAEEDLDDAEAEAHADADGDADAVDDPDDDGTPALGSSDAGTSGASAPSTTGSSRAPTQHPDGVAQPTGAVAPGPAIAQAAGGDVSVEVKDFVFSPASLDIPNGTQVTWTNNGEALHTVSGDNFDSGMLSAGQSFSHTFDSEGSFSYHCEIHPDMQGTIQVSAASPPSPDDSADSGGKGADAGQTDGDSVDSTIGTTDGTTSTTPLAATGISAIALALAAGLALVGGALLLLRRRSRPADTPRRSRPVDTPGPQA